jgi:hypothetical protein
MAHQNTEKRDKTDAEAKKAKEREKPKTEHNSYLG